jgi:hypothetical protein
MTSTTLYAPSTTESQSNQPTPKVVDPLLRRGVIRAADDALKPRDTGEAE